MENLGRAARLLLALIVFICILIVGPAAWFGVLSHWKVVLLAGSYFCFFLSTIGRVFQYGQLTARKEDQQVKEIGGLWASLFTLVGVIGTHWLALYDFAHLDGTTPVLLNQGSTAIALLLIGTAVVLNWTAVQTLGRFFDRIKIQPDHELVTHGVYGVIRHPIYTSYILLLLGFCTMLQSLISIGLLIVVCLIWFGNRIGIEERMLEKKFGEEYRTYCQQTKRLFPYIY